MQELAALAGEAHQLLPRVGERLWREHRLGAVKGFVTRGLNDVRGDQAVVALHLVGYVLLGEPVAQQQVHIGQVLAAVAFNAEDLVCQGGALHQAGAGGGEQASARVFAPGQVPGDPLEAPAGRVVEQVIVVAGIGVRIPVVEDGDHRHVTQEGIHVDGALQGLGQLGLAGVLRTVNGPAKGDNIAVIGLGLVVHLAVGVLAVLGRVIGDALAVVDQVHRPALGVAGLV